MKIPRCPPDIWQIIDQRGHEWREAARDSAYLSFIAEQEQNHYRHWDKIRHVARGQGLDPELAWSLIKFSRLGQSRTTPFQGLTGEKVRYATPDTVVRELHLLDQQTAGRIAADTDGLPTGVERERVILRSLTEEAIASSLLEGAATTRHEAKEMLRTNRRPRSRGERMVLNNYRAMLYVRAHRDQRLTPALLLELQEILTTGTLDDPDQAGRFRTDADTVDIADAYGETLFVPPPAAELPHRLDTICAFANEPNKDEHFIHPVVRACLLHFQMSVDHPFCDGNGRTARAVFYLYLLRHGYWLFEFMPVSTLIRESPSRYAKSFLYAETDDYDATYFLHYNMTIFQRARQQLLEHIERRVTEQRLAVHMFDADPSLNLRQRQLLLKAMKSADRVVTIESHAADYQVSYQTARNDLLNLSSRGYLRKFKAGKQYQFVQGARLAELSETR